MPMSRRHRRQELEPSRKKAKMACKVHNASAEEESHSGASTATIFGQVPRESMMCIRDVARKVGVGVPRALLQASLVDTTQSLAWSLHADVVDWLGVVA